MPTAELIERVSVRPLVVVPDAPPFLIHADGADLCACAWAWTVDCDLYAECLHYRYVHYASRERGDG